MIGHAGTIQRGRQLFAITAEPDADARAELVERTMHWAITGGDKPPDLGSSYVIISVWVADILGAADTNDQVNYIGCRAAVQWNPEDFESRRHAVLDVGNEILDEWFARKDREEEIRPSMVEQLGAEIQRLIDESLAGLPLDEQSRVAEEALYAVLAEVEEKPEEDEPLVQEACDGLVGGPVHGSDARTA